MPMNFPDTSTRVQNNNDYQYFKNNYTGWVLGVLTVINIINVWHRNLVYNLSAVSTPECTEICFGEAFVPLCNLSCDGDISCEKCAMCRVEYENDFYNMKEGACVSNEEYGILVGFGFNIMFAVVGLFAGRLCDVLDRKILHSVAVFMWSAATGVVGLCSSFQCVLLMRVIVSIGEAFNAPACYSLLAYYFANRRSTANGVYSIGTYIGSGISSLCILFATYIGWRNTATISGSFGMFMAVILYLTIEQPEPKSTILRRSTSLFRVVKTLFTSLRVMLLFFATSIRMIGTLVTASYLPLYFNRAFPSYNHQYSLINGTAIAFCGVCSSIIGGTIADLWGKRNPGAFAWVPAIGIGSSLIAAYVVLYCSNFYVCMTALIFQNLLAECWLGPGMAILQREVPREMVGLSVAFLLFCNTLFANTGPALISASDDGTEAVRSLISIQISFSFIISAALFTWLGFILQCGYRDEDKWTGRFEMITWVCGCGNSKNRNCRKNSDPDHEDYDNPLNNERDPLLKGTANGRGMYHSSQLQLSPASTRKILNLHYV